MMTEQGKIPAHGNQLRASDLIVCLFPDAAVASSSSECLKNSLPNSRKNRVEFSWETTDNTRKTGLKSVNSTSKFMYINLTRIDERMEFPFFRRRKINLEDIGKGR